MKISAILFLLIILTKSTIDTKTKSILDLNTLIVGSWKSDTIQNVSAKISFYKNLQGKLKWSNGLQSSFQYNLNDSILTINRDGKLTEHYISKLNKEKLKLKFQPNTEIKRNKEGQEFTSKEIEVIEMLEFSRVK